MTCAYFASHIAAWEVRTVGHRTALSELLNKLEGKGQIMRKLNLFQSRIFRDVSGAYGWLTFNRILMIFLIKRKILPTYSNAFRVEQGKVGFRYITIHCTVLHMACSENIILKQK